MAQGGPLTILNGRLLRRPDIELPDEKRASMRLRSWLREQDRRLMMFGDESDEQDGRKKRATSKPAKRKRQAQESPYGTLGTLIRQKEE